MDMNMGRMIDPIAVSLSLRQQDLMQRRDPSSQHPDPTYTAFIASSLYLIASSVEYVE